MALLIFGVIGVIQYSGVTTKVPECGDVHYIDATRVSFTPSNILLTNVLLCLNFFLDVMTAEQPQVYWHVLGSVLGVIVLICLSLLLYYSER